MSNSLSESRVMKIMYSFLAAVIGISGCSRSIHTPVCENRIVNEDPNEGEHPENQLLKPSLKNSVIAASLTQDSLQSDSVDTSFQSRKENVVRAWLNNDAFDNRTFEAWDERGKAVLRKMGAGFYAFARPDVFSPKDYALISGVNDSSLGVNLYSVQLQSYRDRVEAYLKSIYIDETVGTDVGSLEKISVDAREFVIAGEKKHRHGGDYDFKLKESLPLIYLFKDRPDVVTNEMIWHLVTHNSIEEFGGTVPYSGQIKDLSNPPFAQVYMKNEWMKLKQAETENHMLMIYSWKYLINNYVKWVGSLLPDHPRYDKRIVDLYAAHPVHYTNSVELTYYVLEMLGRVLHNGMFETNSKAYEGFSVSAIQNFFSFADELDLDGVRHYNVLVKTAAQNALDYLSAKFAFQSLNGMRMAPMRRKPSNKHAYGYFENDYVPHIFGVLSGVYAFNDSIDVDSIHRNPQKYPYDFKSIGQQGGFALWSALGYYRIPYAIQDYIETKHTGVWTKAASYYTGGEDDFHWHDVNKKMTFKFDDGHYPLHLEARWSPGVKPRDPSDQEPKYFRETSSMNTYVNDVCCRPIEQRYFIVDDYLNSSGGKFEQYYSVTEKWPNFALKHKPNKQLSEYNSLSRVNAVITPQDENGKTYGYWPKGEKVLDEVKKDLLIMRGNSSDPSQSNNTGTYKNFTCGYTTEKASGWPMEYPDYWNSAPQATFKYDHQRGTKNYVVAEFKVFDFTETSTHPLKGYYVVMARVQKPSIEKVHVFSKGWWEIVPRQAYDSLADLEKFVKAQSKELNYSDLDEPYTYVMASTGETIVMNQRMGSSLLEYPIIDILDTAGESVGERVHGNLPLLSVEEVDSLYNFTGDTVVYAPGNGMLQINNKYTGDTLIIDSRNSAHPKRIVTRRPFVEKLLKL